MLAVAYALAGYPWVGSIVGHRYPYLPTFGLPCPTTIFTLAVLVLARPPVAWSLFVIPIGWSLIGTVAALEFGVVQDYALLVTAAFSLAAAAMRPERRKASGACPSCNVDRIEELHVRPR